MEDSKYSITELKLALLRCLSNAKPEEKYNLLGRSGVPGNLETSMGVVFTKHEKIIAIHAFDELYQSRLIQHNTGCVCGTDNWYEMTDKGKEALDTGNLDDLDQALSSIDESLKSLRYGAKSALKDYSHDSTRQGAHSARELIRQVLTKLAPNDIVMNEDWYSKPIDSSTPVTRRMRIRYILQLKNIPSKSDRAITENACDLIDKLYCKLSLEAHLDVDKDHGDLNELIQLTEFALRKLLL